MIRRPDGLNLRRSLVSVLGERNRSAVEQAATRQERSIDAILQRLYDDDENRRREMVLLADEVGLGKTFVALGVAWCVLHQRSNAGLHAGPVLVVTPHAHALFQKWKREAERFLRLVVPRDLGFDVLMVSAPHELARALRKRKPTLVIARMSAFSGRLHERKKALMAALHSLLHMDRFHLSMNQRLELLEDWSDGTRQSLDLRRSGAAWSAARNAEKVGFDDRHVRAAWCRLEKTDPSLCGRMKDSWERVQRGLPKRSSFWQDLRELCRAALGQTVPHRLPLVIVDEIHNWKNHPASWWRFLHTVGLRMDRLLGLSATPFQLGPHELIQVLGLRRSIGLSDKRTEFLNECVSALDDDLRAAEAAGNSLRRKWTDIREDDLGFLEQAWREMSNEGPPDGVPPRMQQALRALMSVSEAHQSLSRSLKPFLIRHTRDESHRAWWVGCEANPKWTGAGVRGSAFHWKPGLDVTGDAEIVHYLMMRAVQEQKGGRGTTSLGADLGGSYEFFRDGELQRMSSGRNEEASRYLSLVERAIKEDSHEHPKVAVTAGRAFRAWCEGDKTLIFCFNIATVGAVQKAVNGRIKAYTSEVLTNAFRCSREELEIRLKNFQKRLYNYRQTVFLLFQDHPFSGPNGRVPQRLALSNRNVAEVAARAALSGPPLDRSRFDRRRILAATEQVLVCRWRKSAKGREWLTTVLNPLRLKRTLSESIDLILASDWPARRRDVIEGILREAEVEELPVDEGFGAVRHHALPEDISAWNHVLQGRAGQATLAPYLSDRSIEVPSLLTRWHSKTLATLPGELRSLATRMMRRMIRSPGFLARFILDDPNARPGIDEEDADSDWSSLIHSRYHEPLVAGESARARFEAYLETLQKSVGLEELISAYGAASRNRDIVARVTGSVASFERDRFFMGFNTPLVPEVLIVTTVGQEGIDLHRECRHVIHHDLPWNPATLEQRTGRVDRIGSKTERLRGSGEEDCYLDVAIPYIAGTYDEHRFRVVHGRAHLFEVTMGGEYNVDGHRVVSDPMEANALSDDIGERGDAWAPVPEVIARDLRLNLEAESPNHAA